MKKVAAVLGAPLLLLAPVVTGGPAYAGINEPVLCYADGPFGPPVEATIVGSGSITGTEGNDVIVGSAGADTINGLGGDDTICAEGGNDTVNGNAGNDVILARDGTRDRINCGTGRDTVTADRVDKIAKNCERRRFRHPRRRCRSQ